MYCLGLNLHQLLWAKKAEVQRGGPGVGRLSCCLAHMDSHRSIEKGSLNERDKEHEFEDNSGCASPSADTVKSHRLLQGKFLSLGSGGCKHGSVLVRAPFWASHRYRLISSPGGRPLASSLASYKNVDPIHGVTLKGPVSLHHHTKGYGCQRKEFPGIEHKVLCRQ